MENVKDDSVLLIPDVHGREFWRDGVMSRLPGELIIFLGDYTDPYPHEHITHEVVPDMIAEILNIPNTILLLGNHDLSYIYPRQSPAVRKDRDPKRLKRLAELFEDNHDRFKLSYALKMDNNTNVIFTHAGLIKDLYHKWDNKNWTPLEVATKFNEMWKTRDEILPKELFKISWYRGGYDLNGSIVWADVREHVSSSHVFWSHDYQVFGHTILKKGHLITDPQFACVDCQRPVRMWWNNKRPIFEVL